MRRIITIVIAFAIASWSASAQITISKLGTERARQVATLSMSWSWLYQQGDDYYIVLNSDNQFDDAYWLKIGSTREECLKSLNDLIAVTETMEEKDMFDLDNGEGEKLNARYYSALGIKGLKVSGKGHAGDGILFVANMKKAVKWIEKNAE